MVMDTCSKFKPCIIVHGGAWAIPDVLKEPSVNGVKKAAKKGYERLVEVNNGKYVIINYMLSRLHHCQ